MKYKIAICDDEQIFIEDIVEKIQKITVQCEIETFHSGEELLEKDLEFDILFLDIEMEGMNGIETAVELRKRQYEGLIIFLTSHREFVYEAFQVEAFRFLVKPVEAVKLEEALSAAYKKFILRDTDTRCLVLNKQRKDGIVKVRDVVYLEAYGDGTYIYDVHGNMHTTKRPLKYWKEQLNEVEFYQIHKSVVVSFAHVRRIIPEGKLEVETYEEALTISRRNKKAFQLAYNEYRIEQFRRGEISGN